MREESETGDDSVFANGKSAEWKHLLTCKS